jgi:hypothetical protein
MPEYVTLRSVRLGPTHRPTGKTRHLVGGQEMAVPSELRIVQYSGDRGYYLLYLDANGCEQTDTYHDSIDDAMAQAEWEFTVSPGEWMSILDDGQEN